MDAIKVVPIEEDKPIRVVPIADDKKYPGPTTTRPVASQRGWQSVKDTINRTMRPKEGETVGEFLRSAGETLQKKYEKSFQAIRPTGERAKRAEETIGKYAKSMLSAPDVGQQVVSGEGYWGQIKKPEYWKSLISNIPKGVKNFVTPLVGAASSISDLEPSRQIARLAFGHGRESTPRVAVKAGKSIGELGVGMATFFPQILVEFTSDPLGTIKDRPVDLLVAAGGIKVAHSALKKLASKASRGVTFTRPEVESAVREVAPLAEAAKKRAEFAGAGVDPQKGAALIAQRQQPIRVTPIKVPNESVVPPVDQALLDPKIIEAIGKKLVDGTATPGERAMAEKAGLLQIIPPKRAPLPGESDVLSRRAMGRQGRAGTQPQVVSPDEVIPAGGAGGLSTMESMFNDRALPGETPDTFAARMAEKEGLAPPKGLPAGGSVQFTDSQGRSVRQGADPASRIIQALQDYNSKDAYGQYEWMRISDLKKSLSNSGLSPAEIDRMLLQMDREKKVQLIHNDDPTMKTPEEEAGAIDLGGGVKRHMVRISDKYTPGGNTPVGLSVKYVDDKGNPIDYKGGKVPPMSSIPEPGADDMPEVPIESIGRDRPVQPGYVGELKGALSGATHTAKAPSGGTQNPTYALKVRARAKAAGLPVEYWDLPEYKVNHFSEKMPKVRELVKSDPETAKQIAYGEAPTKFDAPQGLFAKAVEDWARESGDTETLQNLARAKTSSEKYTRYGQEIGSLGYRDPESPVVAIEDIMKSRQERANLSGKAIDPKVGAEDITRLNAEIDRLNKELEKRTSEATINAAIDEARTPQPRTRSTYGTRNRIVTKERYDIAIGKLRDYGSRMNFMGLDPTMIEPMVEAGVYHIEAGARSFAEWSARMKSGAGDWIDRHLPELWERSKQYQHDNEIGDVKRGISEKMASGEDIASPDSPALFPYAQRLARQFASEGVNDSYELVKAIHGALSEVVPGITLEQTRNLFSYYGKHTTLSKEPLTVRLREMRGEQQQVAKLEDLQTKGYALKTGSERRTPSALERKLIAQVNMAKKKYGVPITDPDTMLRSPQDALKKRLSDEIAKTEEKLLSLDTSMKERIPVRMDSETVRLKERRDGLVSATAAIQKRMGDLTKPEAEKVVALAKTTADAKAAMEAGENRLIYGAATVEFQKYVKKLKGGEPSINDRISDRFGEFKTSLRVNPTAAVLDVVKDSIRKVSDNSISMVAAVDNSFLGRQGLTTLMTHPTIWWDMAGKSFKDIFTAMAKKDGYEMARDAVLADAYSRPNFVNGNYTRAKLIPKFEEQYPSGAIAKVPGLGRLFKASEVAFTNSAIRARIDLYDYLSDLASKKGVEVGDTTFVKNLGKLVNSMTARGELGKVGEGGVVRMFLWAPKMIKANYDILTAHTGGAGFHERGSTYSGEGFLKKQAAQNLAKVVLETAAVAAIANAIKPGCVESDPRSSDFMKVRIGNTRFDLTGGKGSIVTLIARSIPTFGGIKNTENGGIAKVGTGKYGEPDAITLGLDFLLNKTTPIVRAATQDIRNRYWGGKKPTPMEVSWGLTAPISIQNFVKNAWGDDANRSVEAVVGSVLDIFGVSTNTYTPRKTKPKATKGYVPMNSNVNWK
jgi:hypothetical protein